VSGCEGSGLTAWLPLDVLPVVVVASPDVVVVASPPLVVLDDEESSSPHPVIVRASSPIVTPASTRGRTRRMIARSFPSGRQGIRRPAQAGG
jgi:hypothetical protein